MDEKKKRALIVVLVIHVIVLNLTWRDLRHRPRLRRARPEANVARVAAAMNTTGSVAYWLLGRRRLPELEIVDTVA